MVTQRRVDTAPNCGNMLCAIGPFAVEHGLVNAGSSIRQADHPLLSHPRILCTPHLGYVEKHSYEAYFGEAFANVRAFAMVAADRRD